MVKVTTKPIYTSAVKRDAMICVRAYRRVGRNVYVRKVKAGWSVFEKTISN